MKRNNLETHAVIWRESNFKHHYIPITATKTAQKYHGNPSSSPGSLTSLRCNRNNKIQTVDKIQIEDYELFSHANPHSWQLLGLLHFWSYLCKKRNGKMNFPIILSSVKFLRNYSLSMRFSNSFLLTAFLQDWKKNFTTPDGPLAAPLFNFWLPLNGVKMLIQTGKKRDLALKSTSKCISILKKTCNSKQSSSYNFKYTEILKI